MLLKVVSVQEEKIKKKQVEQLIRDKAKGLKRIDATNSRNKWSAVLAVQVDLNRKELKTWLMIWGN
jgi:hypothetical protein